MTNSDEKSKIVCCHISCALFVPIICYVPDFFFLIHYHAHVCFISFYFKRVFMYYYIFAVFSCCFCAK